MPGRCCVGLITHKYLAYLNRKDFPRDGPEKIRTKSILVPDSVFGGPREVRLGLENPNSVWLRDRIEPTIGGPSHVHCFLRMKVMNLAWTSLVLVDFVCNPWRQQVLMFATIQPCIPLFLEVHGDRSTLWKRESLIWRRRIRSGHLLNHIPTLLIPRVCAILLRAESEFMVWVQINVCSYIRYLKKALS